MNDLALSLVVLGSTALAGVAYLGRMATKGSVRSARIERGGSNVLLGRDVQEMGYFALAPLGRACVRLGVSANAITALSLTLGAAAGIAIGVEHFGLAGLLGALSLLGDALDGMVARANGTASDAGEVLDAAVDRYVELFVFAGLCHHFAHSALGFGLTMLALVGSFMVSYTTAKAEALRVDAPRGAMRRAERAVYLTAGIVLVPVAGWWVARTGAAPWLRDAPLLASLALVGIIANVSTVLRVRAVSHRIARRDPAPKRPLPSRRLNEG
jgi:CDP-diacylglycerol--glycerol-3-phosphate 3-phosphatidyltransferase